jgi:hypothetical protein
MYVILILGGMAVLAAAAWFSGRTLKAELPKEEPPPPPQGAQGGLADKTADEEKIIYG